MAAMWMGRPELTVSVAKTLRKSCGEYRIGVPSTSVMPAWVASLARSFDVGGSDDGQAVQGQALEQVRQRRAERALVGVVALQQRNRPVGVFDAADDAGQDGDEVGVGGDDPFVVGPRRADLQQRHHLPGRGVVLAQAQVRELEHLFQPGAGAPQDLDGRPGPERLVLGDGGVEPPVRFGGLPQDQGGRLPGLGGCAGPLVAEALDGEVFAGRRGAGGGQDPPGVGELLLGRGGEAGQDWGESVGAVVHAGSPAPFLLDGAAHVCVGDRARRGPLSS